MAAARELSRVLDVRALGLGSEIAVLHREFAGIPLCAATDQDLPGATPAEKDIVRAKCRCT